MCETYNISSAKVYRHRWESPMLVIATLATIGAIIVNLASIIVVVLGGADVSNEWGSFAYIVLFSPILLLLARSYVAAQNRTNGARVGPNQLS
ncbi:hypothetical protein [Celeribacter marinus]|uniref:hypothetical protein n=1 Tax=Celeribacter marinus TaxID=1397108 RepID=UPI003173EB96